MTYELAAGSEAAAENDGGASPAAVDAVGGRHDEAGAAVKINGEPEWLRRIIGWFYKPPAQRKRELARRLQQLDAAVGDAPDSLTHYVLRGELFLQIEDHDRAAADFEAALELAETLDPTKGWGLVEQVMRDRALRGLDLARRRL